MRPSHDKRASYNMYAQKSGAPHAFGREAPPLSLDCSLASKRNCYKCSEGQPVR